MDQYHQSDLEGLKLRGLIAFAARCARRVFPVLVLANDAVQECDEAIAMAGSFAAGEPGVLIRVRRVAAAVSSDPMDEGHPRDPQNTWYARHTVIELASATVSAFSAVTHIPPSKAYCQEAAEHAGTAVRYASWTTERLRDSVAINDAQYQEFDREHPVRALEARWARQARDHDFEALRKSHGGVVTDLGLALDISPRGPLGPLWLADQVPGWYQEGLSKWRRPRDIVVVTGDEFILSSGNLDPFPDLVCWYLRPVGTEAGLEELEDSLRKVKELSRSRGLRTPGLVVYASRLAEEKRFAEEARVQLFKLGAIVFADPPDERFEPSDDQSLCEVLRSRLEEVYEGWEQDDKGLWLNKSARVKWRGWMPPLATSSIDEPQQLATEQSRSEDTATKEDYRDLLKYLESDPWESEY